MQVLFFFQRKVFPLSTTVLMLSYFSRTLMPIRLTTYNTFKVKAAPHNKATATAQVLRLGLLARGFKISTTRIKDTTDTAMF
jgi:hypothetical protein